MKSITIHGLDEGLDKSIRDKARERGLSINKTLKELSYKLPQTKAEMLSIHGIGEVKFDRYGEEFLVLLSKMAS